jgi:HNH endonuclease
MPQINEIAHGQDIGKKAGYDYIFLSCSVCNKPRWVKTVLVSQPNYKNTCIHGCQQQLREKNANSNNTLYWDGKSELKLNMQKSSTELVRLGILTKIYDHVMMEWHECPQCNDRYWRQLNAKGRKTNSPICFKCTRINNGKMMRGERSGQWKGGHSITKSGYVNVILHEDSPYYCMAREDGRVFEHRLVYAEYLGRPLKPWEIIHHKDRIKSHNTIDNLELTNGSEHISYTRSEQTLDQLLKRVTLLEAENTLLKSQVETKIRESF